MRVKIETGIPYGVEGAWGGARGVEAHSVYYEGEFEGGVVHQRILAAPDDYEVTFDEGGMHIRATDAQIKAKTAVRKEYRAHLNKFDPEYIRKEIARAQRRKVRSSDS